MQAIGGGKPAGWLQVQARYGLRHMMMQNLLCCRRGWGENTASTYRKDKEEHFCFHGFTGCTHGIKMETQTGIDPLISKPG
jgi:hypothetical protein